MLERRATRCGGSKTNAYLWIRIYTCDTQRGTHGEGRKEGREGPKAAWPSADHRERMYGSTNRLLSFCPGAFVKSDMFHKLDRVILAAPTNLNTLSPFYTLLFTPDVVVDWFFGIVCLFARWKWYILTNKCILINVKAWKCYRQVIKHLYRGISLIIA